MVKLEIWVANQWLTHPKIVELGQKGHCIHALDIDEKPDLILHPNAWRWDDTKWEFIDVALKEARKGQPARVAKAGSKPSRGKRPKRPAKE